MLRDHLRDFGLSGERLNALSTHFKDLKDIIQSEDYEVAAIGDMSISEARNLKKFLIDRMGKMGIGGDFLKRWGKTASQENVEKTYQEYKKLSRIYPDSPVIWQIKGELLEKMDRMGEAMEAYRRALKLYDDRGEIPPRELEEKVRGKVYRYRSNGNGYGLINGLGFQNGRIINGFRNGFKNGIINGSGLVNGTKELKSGREPRGLRFLITLVLILLILYTPLFTTYLFEKHYVYSVDGNFGEWKSEIPYIDLKGDTGDGNIDILMMKFHPSRDGIFFYMRTRNPIFENSSGIYIFIDIDNMSSTGYNIGTIGAEYMVEIYGWNSTIVGKSLYFFNSTDRNDFAGFEGIGSVPAQMRGREIEGLIPINYKKFRVIAITTDYHGRYDFSYCPDYGNKDFMVVERAGRKVIKLNESDVITEIETKSYTRAVINSIDFGYYGTSNPLEIETLSLYEDDGDGVFDSGDKLIADGYGINDGKIEFENLNLEIGNSTLFVVVKFTKDYLFGKTAMLHITKIITDIPYVVENHIVEYSYIGGIPQDVHIDGSFEDWRIKKNDNIGDVINPAGTPVTGDENIDILEYSASIQKSLLFYINVNGKILGGSDCPILRRFVLPDSDGDTVPDRFDPLPHDFNNDGIPDNRSYVVVDGEKLPDVDGDGIGDYPYGNDYWLNTTIPDNFPKPYAGKVVHRYIGPIPVRKIYGRDTIRIYINSDNNISTGFSLPGYPIGADYMVEIYGRDGKVENSSLDIYTQGRWLPAGNVNYAVGYHEIEINSNISTRNATSLIILSDWDSDRDVSDTPFFSHTATRSDEVHKQLHLHYNATSQNFYTNTSMGTHGYYVNIPAGYYAQWNQIPVFAEDFDIISYPTISLYLVPHPTQWWWWIFIPGMNVSLWVYNRTSGYREIGYDYNPDCQNSGWYNFTIKNTTTINRGEAIYLRTAVTGFQTRPPSIDIYFNTSRYDSRIDLPTDTYINVDWIRTYNSTAQTDIFNPDEQIYIDSMISDPFGSYDIKNANITIYYPNGTVFVDNVSMTEYSSYDSHALFRYSTTLPAIPGAYTIRIYGVETNGVISTRTSNFIIRAEQGVAIYPDETKNGNPGDDIYFNLTLENIGNVDDTYEILPTQPTHQFPFKLYINDSLAARDDNGDGIWDWVNSTWDRDNDGRIEVSLLSLQRANLSVVKNVPLGTWGESDLTIFNASSETNATVYDNARIRVNVPYHSQSKVLYLNDTDKLSVKHGESTSTITIRNGNSYSWTLPRVYYSVNLTGYILASIYMDASPSPWSGIAVKVSLYYDSTLIGEDEVIGNGKRWYTFTIESQVDTIPAGSSLILTISVTGYGTSAIVYYNSSQYPSNITIPTTDYIRIRSLKLYNSSGETYNFSAGENVIVKARISSPFGVEDIGNAYLNITDPVGNKKVDSTAMNLQYSSGGDKIYTYTYALPNDAFSGYWNVRVDTHDDPVIHTNASTQFFILWDVNITPNHNITTNVSTHSRYFLFNHTITNTGLGADIFEIVATSQNGFDIQLIINGTLAAEDYNGDGAWDYVNPSYDTDGDGNPDTGILLPQESINITVAVEIPANFTGVENVDVETYSFLSQGINDHAYDKINVIPEFTYLFTPLIIAILLIKRRRRLLSFHLNLNR